MSKLHESLKNADDIKIASRKKINLFYRITKIKNAARTWLSGLDKNGYEHSERLESYLDFLTSDLRKTKKITPAETFILLCATYLHDIGYNNNGNIVSEGHAKRSQDMILANPSKYYLGDFPLFDGHYPRIAEAVGLVCLGHKGEIYDDNLHEIPDEFLDYIFGNENLNLRKLTALLRLADEADDPYIRFNPSNQSIRRKIPLVQIKDKNIIWHWDKTREKDSTIFKNYLEEKLLILESSINYLRTTGAGAWFLVLQPQVPSSQLQNTNHVNLSEKKRLVHLLSSIDQKITKILEEKMEENTESLQKKSFEIRHGQKIKTKLVEEDFSDLPRIVVVGCGGAGNNTVNRIHNIGIPHIETIAINTDKRGLDKTQANKRILIGKSLTKGLGAEGYPDVGKRAAEMARPTLEAILESVDFCFITAGMGGGTGSGSAPVIAQIAKEQGAIVVGIVSYPFRVEKARLIRAEIGLEELSSIADIVIVLDNNRLKNFVPNLPLGQAFSIMDQLIIETVKGISETLTEPSFINIDYADVRTIMSKGGIAVMLIGESKQQDKVESVVQQCLSNPMLNLDYRGATGCLIHITGGTDLTLQDAEKTVKLLTHNIDPHADVVLGAHVRRDMEGKIRVFAIMTGIRKSLSENVSHDIIGDLEKMKKANIPPNELSIDTLKKNTENYQKEIDELKTTTDYLRIRDVWKDFARQGLTGRYTLEETLLLLTQVIPPFSLLESEYMREVKTDSVEYQEMVQILNDIRNGKNNEEFTSKVGVPDLKKVILDPNFNFTMIHPTRLSALIFLISENIISTTELQHYFYINKKFSSDETVDDIIINLIILFMMTFSMRDCAGINHGKILDSIIANEDPWKGVVE